MPRVMSGIQPSGDMTIGNYLGAIQPFVSFQEQHDCVFMIADLHAMTVAPSPELLRERIVSAYTMVIACGIDPDKTVLFVQSHVPAHTQLSWVLMTMTGMGELERMTQFKDKGQDKPSVGVGLFAYPVLQAADILLYQADFVPVGDDQRQHLELTRDVAGRFNQRYGDTFVLPEPYFAREATRTMSLVDGRKKMSKSDPQSGAYISLFDPPEVIRRKIMRATTDSGNGIFVDWTNKPEISNLLQLYAACAGQSIATLMDRYEGVGYGVFKRDLAEVVVQCVQPIQQRYADVVASGAVSEWMQTGAERANRIATTTWEQVRSRIGCVSVPQPK